jgi:hypothetical protein
LIYIPNIALWDYCSTTPNVLKDSTERKIIMVETVFSFPPSEGILIISEDLDPEIRAEMPKCFYDSALIKHDRTLH